MGVCFRLSAQLCQGSLGDPLVNISFGSGSNPGPPLSAAAVGYQYVSNDCPADGFYAVRTNTANCFASTWHSVNSDHTGNGNGYFMVINASNQPSDFYVDTIRGLCSATTYEFATWVLNVLKPSSCNGASIKPNITFKIEKIDGALLQQYNTGNIDPSDIAAWLQYGFFFTTPAGVQDIVIRMRNNAPGGCGNDLLLDDITFRPCGPRLTPSFANNSGALVNLCEGVAATVTLNCAVSSGFTSPFYQWQEKLPNATTWIDIPGANATTFVKAFPATAAAGIYEYRLTVVENANRGSAACTIASSALAVRVNPKPGIAVSNSGPVCEGAPVNFMAGGGVQYSWTGPNGFTASGSQVSIINAKLFNSGTYYVEMTSTSGCNRTDSTKLVVNAKPIAVVSADTVRLCQGKGELLTASGGVSYTWFPTAGLSRADLASTFASPADTTNYSVVVTGDGGCKDTANVQVNVIPIPKADAGPDKNLLAGESVMLEGRITGAEYTFLWKPDYFINDPSSLRPTVNPPQDTSYILMVTSLLGCGSYSDSVSVHVFQDIKVPNVFTPNGDGINDRWEIPALVAYHHHTLLVFNRYGQKVFESRNYTIPWDGKYNGRSLPVGTYYYIIDLKDKGAQLSGSIEILR
ncbi:MAG: hypothetical protein JWP88_2356 [Flaviaesturariibacter sp.]|nr:hypothetical protein [Flaviaesturariibacter sp.]